MDLLLILRMILTVWTQADVQQRCISNELMAGRYDPMSKATAFNDGDDRYEGMLVVRSELTSMCPNPP